ncbi:MAG: helix-turn-helix transcriptional regulator [Nitrospinaceae bacterium]|nr:helix-turn-helix transcriptional regulator [Nitrospina sp.]MBT5377147.1 helix-turn-helix transcriptional regulator [Nitrospinaceae bacterium]MBT5868542.1 helix-turn-helix transcriptional regulator [Nitrospinaceae bacterium]MBT6346846.1 helix-turn-helix transcriptional regulator [Nitrospina sp.]
MNSKLNKRILLSRNSKGFTQKQLAKLLNISLPSMNHYETGKRIPSAQLLATLADIVECDPGWLLTGMEKKDAPQLGISSVVKSLTLEDFVLVPRYNAPSGKNTTIHSEQIVDHLAFKAAWVNQELGADPKNLLLIHSKGDAMEPTIRSGDLLLVDQSESIIKGDGIYLIRIEDGMMVKRVQWLLGGSSAILCGDNSAVSKEQTLSSAQMEKLHILGRVVWVGSKL